MSYILIDIGMQPEEPLNVSLLLPLPANTPYGNFQLKWMDMISRLNEANRQIIISYENWCAARTGSIEDSMKDVFNKHRFSTEYAVSGMRRVADELVALVWCMHQLRDGGEIPSRVRIDTIGLIFKHNYHGPDGLFERHLNFIKLLNDLSNTFKHSFIQSDLARIGENEPLVLALNLERADLENESQFYAIKLSAFISDYNCFFNDCREWLRSML
ncbi:MULTISPECIES: hypothetical protein [Pseudomonas]|uniref:Uncharacterized protein n=1 Tax=Pseudomonas plecoglossicida TaxID=70775 RepID=A0A2R7UP12_PSEDL|nr:MULTISPECIES: hypothetical protein [Pseudomonas]MBF8709919.1 hypothetical protein [Pseudomonas putida]PTU53913.1 hypothetical protein DBB42_02285 [Pseudomonas plecoglossicida]